MKYVKNMNTKIGTICIVEEDNFIVELRINPEKQTDSKRKDTPLLKETEKQLKEYFTGERKKFDVPLKPKGTKFMNQVWTALQDIPYGEVRTYQQIAKQVGNPKAARAVGMANHRNPIPILIPCHRVIGSSGELVGYALGISMKKFLLELEEKQSNT